MKYSTAKKLIERCPYSPEYHFDSEIQDPRWDTIIPVGNLSFELSNEEQQQLVDASNPIGCELGKYGRADIDTTKSYVSADPKYVVNNMNYSLPLGLQRAGELFALEEAQIRAHVQLPGQTWNVHIDKLQFWSPDYSQEVIRFVMHVTDWEPGHFWHYGNYMHAHWRRGDVHTFDWMQVPHSTANAGLCPRITLLITGRPTDQTRAVLSQLKQTDSYQV